MTASDFSVRDVLAWARTKPAGERYDYVDNHNCPIAQFLRETGRAKKPWVHPDEWWDGRSKTHRIDFNISSAANSFRSNTFGKFADRLEAISVSA